MKKIKLIALLFISLCAVRHALCEQIPLTPEVLTQQIIEAKTKEDACRILQESKDFYFGNNQYNEFAVFLGSLKSKRQDLEPAINYYLGLTRYQQLKYLEEAQEWNEYFNKGDSYRAQLTESLQKAIESTSYLEASNLYSRLVLWQYYKDRDDPLKSAVLSGLSDSVNEYSKSKQDIEPVRKIADVLISCGEKPKAKELYAIYVKKITSAEITDAQIKESASGFYQEGNLELSESLYDVYIERILPENKGKTLSALKDIAAKFVYQDGAPGDPLYAEKIFKKIEEIGTRAALQDELIYMRAFNLEKLKDFSGARDIYLDLIERYPKSSHFDEAVFKAGIITTYILRDINSGRSFFERLVKKEAAPSPQIISSYYQLGLLAQWEGDLTKAGEYYGKLIEKATVNFSDTVTLTQCRLREIEEEKPIEYNLKTFLDVSLKKDFALQQMHNADLISRPSKLQKGGELNLEVIVHPIQSGCIPVELRYLWSGHIEETGVSGKHPSLKTSYNCRGSKEINLVIVSPTGIIQHCIDLIDVY